MYVCVCVYVCMYVGVYVCAMMFFPELRYRHVI
jgi:hypothetical protein